MGSDVQATRTTFSFNWVGICATVAVTVSLFGLGYYIVGSDFRPLNALLILVSIMLVSVVPAYLIYLLSKRNTMSTNIGYAISLTVLAGIFVFSVISAGQDPLGNDPTRSATSELDTGFADTDAKYDEIVKRSRRGEAIFDEQTSILEDQAATFDRAADIAEGTEAKVLQVMADLNKKIAELSAVQAEAAQAFTNAGGVSAQGLDSPEMAAERLRALERLQDVNEHIDSEFAVLGEWLMDKFVGAGLDNDVAEIGVRNWEKGARPDLFALMRDSDRKILAKYKEAIVLLGDESGRWTVDPTNGVLSFRDSTVRAKHDSIIADLDKLLAEQQAIQERMIRAAQSGAAQP